jgi:hypothetical protein
MNKVYIRFIGLITLLALISGAVIYFTIDMNTIKNLTAFQPWSVLLALAAISLGLVLDGTRLMHLVKISNEKITLYQAVQVVFGNYFLAMLTPGATGGAVAQLVFLRHAGVPTGKATVLVVVRTVLSILFLMMCLPVIFYYDNNLAPWISPSYIWNMTLLMFLAVLLLIYVIKKNLSDYIVVKIALRLSKKRRRSFISLYRDTKGAARLLKSAPASMVRVYFESGFSLIAIYSVVPILFMGIGVDVNWPIVMGRMIFLNILLYFSPTPGGSGIAEGGFVFLFSEFLPSGIVGIAAVTWRMITEYLPFLIGFFYTIKVFGRDFLNKQLNR